MVLSDQDITPLLKITPEYLEFGTGSRPLLNLKKPEITLTITNVGQGILTGKIKPQVSWLTISPDEFSCSAGESSEHQVSVGKDARSYWDSHGRYLNNLFLVISNTGSTRINGIYTPTPGSLQRRALISWLMVSTGVLMIIALVGIGIFTMGLPGTKTSPTPDMDLLFTRGAGTEIARLTQSPQPSDTPQPSATAMLAAQNTPTLAATLTFTPWPRDAFPNPEVFISSYYQAINDKKLDQAWEMLSDNFKESCCIIAGNDPYAVYQTWWKPITKVSVNSAYLQKWDTNPASVYVSLKYTYKDGKTEDVLFDFSIIADQDKNTLLIDVVKPLK